MTYGFVIAKTRTPEWGPSVYRGRLYHDREKARAVLDSIVWHDRAGWEIVELVAALSAPQPTETK